MTRIPGMGRVIIMKCAAFLICLLILLCDASGQSIAPDRSSITGRFVPPEGYLRRAYQADSFQNYLRAIPLKKYGVPVMLYDGTRKEKDVHVSVLDIPLLKADLIQCADIIMLVRAHYLFRMKRYHDISFSLANGVTVPFPRYAAGYRLKITGNKSAWRKGGYKSGNTRAVLDEYLRFIYAYAGTASLARDMKRVDLSDIDIGDVFIQGGSPGHAVMVIDLAENRRTGKKIMLLAQSYMPSQEMHILKSFSDIQPWYYVEDADLETPEWHFRRNSLRRFR